MERMRKKLSSRKLFLITETGNDSETKQLKSDVQKSVDRTEVCQCLLLQYKKMSIYLLIVQVMNPVSVVRLFEDIYNSVGGHVADFFALKQGQRCC